MLSTIFEVLSLGCYDIEKNRYIDIERKKIIDNIYHIEIYQLENVV